MHILVVNFQLDGMSHDEIAAMAEAAGPLFGNDIPGLHEKVFLSDPETNTYGGIYKFADRAALDAYLAGAVWASVAGEPRFVHLRTRTFGVFEEATRAAHGIPLVAIA